ncbi:MlaD family protein [Salibacteraceae bacterium]|nr:MlaD family protein [Salibacteraceae bacterium]MDB9709474.1 MlaD family protein [Salibacteraceae bacterium]HAQ70237.1 MCE family protein [Flavobacteriales bacterium]
MKIGSEIKVGAVIIVALGLLYFGMNYLKGSDVFSKSRSFYAIYEKVDGLSTDNVVLVNGFKVGRVASITLIPENGNLIMVEMEILEDQLNIPDSSVARIVSEDVLGTKAISLEFTQDTIYHVSGDTLISDIDEALQSIIEEKLAPLQLQIEGVIAEARDLVTTTKILVTTTNESIEKAKTSMDIINKTTRDIDKLVVTQNENLTRVLGDITAIASNIRNNSKNINAILENVATISDSLTRANYAAAIENATNALTQLDSMITKINEGEGSLGMLLNDDKLYKNLEQASLEIDKLAEDLRVNPERYVHISVFGKKEDKEDKPKKKDRKE